MGWTPKQQNAIDARGQQILVTAAAGSGKTSVLTERVKNILCDENNKCSVNEILVVTFTKAAAKEMRTRISEALVNEIKETKSAYLKEQLRLLPTADICTIDSFCAKIVKENFNLADISFDYDMLSDGEEKALLSETVKEVIEEQYENGSEEFEKVNKMFLTERDDSKLSDVILSLHRFSMSYPNPLLWLKTVTDYYESDIYDTPWVCAVLSDCELTFSHHLANMKKAVKMMKNDGGFSEKYFVFYEEYVKQVERFLEFCTENDYDGFVSALRNFAFLGERCSYKGADESVKKFVQNTLKDFKEDLKKLWEQNIPLSFEHEEDLQILLEEKGLVRDGKLFYLQYKLSAYDNKIQPGVYTLNTSMLPKEMMIEMCPSEDKDAVDTETEEATNLNETMPSEEVNTSDIQE